MQGKQAHQIGETRLVVARRWGLRVLSAWVQAAACVVAVVCSIGGCTGGDAERVLIVGVEPPEGFNPYARRDPITGEVLVRQREPGEGAGLEADPTLGLTGPAPVLPAGFSGPTDPDATGLGLGLASARRESAAENAGDGEADFGAPSDVEALFGGERASGPGPAMWSIVLGSFRGDLARSQAETAAEGWRSLPGLDGLRVEQRDAAAVVALGAYPAHDAPSAQADLRRVRAMDVQGARPFAGAVLTPPGDEALAGSLPMLDLRRARELHGEEALYTLQVGVYGREDGGPPPARELADYRAAAEAAAWALRRQGDLAFYYHAPHRSMVTVGLFGEEDHDPYNRPGFESARLRDLRARHPLNLLNGQGIRQRVRGRPENDPKAWRMQASSLVAVPE